MKLIDLIQKLSSVERQSTVYQENLKDLNSDIIVIPEEEIQGSDNEMIWVENGRTYHYLIEVFIAADFLEDWTGSLSVEVKS